MSDVKVTCITKKNFTSSHANITHFGSLEWDWNWTLAAVIASIEAKTNTFYTLIDGNRADIGVLNAPTGKYLRAYADGKWNDDLLALPECG